MIFRVVAISAGIFFLLPISLFSDTDQERILILNNDREFFVAGKFIKYLKDDSKLISMDEIMKPGMEDKFIQSNSEIPEFGFTNSPIWAKLTIKNLSSRENWIFEIKVPIIDQLRFFRNDAGKYTPIESGLEVPFSKREIKSGNFLFSVHIPQNSTLTYYIRLKTRHQNYLNIEIASPEILREQELRERTYLSIYIGIILAMAFYNLFLFVSFRDKSYLYYFLCGIFSITYNASLTGVLTQYITGDFPQIALKATPVSVGFLLIFHILFAINFLQIKEKFPQFMKFLKPFYFFMFFFIFSQSIRDFKLVEQWNPYVQKFYGLVFFVTFALSFLLGVHLLMKKYRPAYYYFSAFTILIIFSVLNLFTQYSILERNSITQYGTILASTFEMMILSLGIADRINILRKEKDEFKEFANAKSNFLATMSHELRTPLNGVLGLTQLLAKTELSPLQREHVDLILHSGESLFTIINDILDISKMESGNIELEEIPFELYSSISNSVNLFNAVAIKKNLKLFCEIDPSVPLYAAGDPTRMKQIIMNLVGNSVKFTDKGFIKVKVRAGEIKNEEFELFFSIEDSGIGIDKEKLESIFLPFTQVDASVTRRFGGSGLGLSISQKLAELMGGGIYAESHSGNGSSFFVQIRLKRTTKDLIQLPEEIGEKFRKEINPGLKILLAEDNEVNQKLALHLFKRLGFSIDLAVNGLEAVRLVETHKYDCIFMDIQMPELDGFSATRQILKNDKINPKPVIIAMTANALDSDREKCLDAGMKFYLSKPIKLNEIERVLWEIS